MYIMNDMYVCALLLLLRDGRALRDGAPVPHGNSGTSLTIVLFTLITSLPTIVQLSHSDTLRIEHGQDARVARRSGVRRQVQPHRRAARQSLGAPQPSPRAPAPRTSPIFSIVHSSSTGVCCHACCCSCLAVHRVRARSRDALAAHLAWLAREASSRASLARVAATQHALVWTHVPQVPHPKQFRARWARWRPWSGYFLSKVRSAPLDAPLSAC